MARSDRLLRLMQALRRLPAPVTAARLAEELDVSLRTIYRDIESLRVSGAVIDGSAGYGYVVTEDPSLPPMQFEAAEVEALVLGLREVSAIGDSALVRAAENALSKIGAAIPERMRTELDNAVVTAWRFAERPTATVDPARLRNAARAEKAVNIGYADAYGNKSDRRVWPLSIVYMDNAEMLLAYCHLREAFRCFRLDRINDMTELDESFRPRRVKLLRECYEVIGAPGDPPGSQWQDPQAR